MVRPHILSTVVAMATLILAGCGAAAPPSSLTASSTPPPASATASYRSPATLKSVLGESPRVEMVTNDWVSHEHPDAGFSVRTPADWHVDSDVSTGEMQIALTETQDETPHPAITFNFISDHPFDPIHPLLPLKTASQSIEIGGRVGITYEDDAYAIPTQSYYIELPHRHGTLLISATKGPYVNLIPQLEEVLKTLKLYP